MSSQVRPIFSNIDLGNDTPRYTELARESRSWSEYSTLELFSDVTHIFIRQLRHAVRLSVHVSAFTHCVQGVIERIASKQMVWIYARRVIALMQNVNVRSQLYFVGNLVCKSVCTHSSSGHPKISVTSFFRNCASPIPALSFSPFGEFCEESWNRVISITHDSMLHWECGCQLKGYGL